MTWAAFLDLGERVGRFIDLYREWIGSGLLFFALILILRFVREARGRA